MSEENAPDVAAIAGRLSEAQRRWLPEFDATPRQWYPVGCSTRTLNTLIRIGLVKRHAPESRVGFIRWSLTPLGLSVRQLLMEKNDVQG